MIGFACLFLGLVLASQVQSPIQFRGRVIDAATREPIAKALVSIRSLQIQTITDDAGNFTLPNIPTGRLELYVSTVGYGLLKQEIEATNASATPVEILLGQEAFRRSDKVTVTADIFETADTNNASEHTLNNTELKNLANVLVDDPLRSVQTLPGVAAGDDFNAQFAVRASGFRSIGFYIDGVLANEPFHTVRDINDSGSLTVLNGDLVESLSLFSGAAPARYGDRTGAVLNVETRYGNAERVVGRANIAATGMSYTAEGPLGHSRKLTWIASARKSYADWLIRKLSDDPNLAVALGFIDFQGNLSYAPSNQHRFTLTTLLGKSRADRERERSRLGPNSFLTGDAKTGITNARWRWLQTRLVSQTGFYVSSSVAENVNAGSELLFKSFTQDVGFRNDTAYQISRSHRIEAGIFIRRLSEDSQRRRFSSGAGFAVTSRYETATWQPGFYADDVWKVGDRVIVTAGGRFDSFGKTGQHIVLPRISASYRLHSRTTITAAYGRFAQFPEFQNLYGGFGVPSLRAERSEQRIVAIEHRITDKTRLRAELYDYKNSSLIYSEETEPRLVAGQIVRPMEAPVLRNALDGYSRGIELYLQRRSANRLSGWISYSLGFSRLRDSLTGRVFDADFDQRHTASVYASYRLTKALNLSSKFRYGSNFPAAGFYTFNGSRLFLSDRRNLVRLPVYSRLDARTNYAFHFERWKLTLYAEVTNVLGRTNVRFTDLDRVANSGQVLYVREKLLPFLPAAGLSVEF